MCVRALLLDARELAEPLVERRLPTTRARGAMSWNGSWDHDLRDQSWPDVVSSSFGSGWWQGECTDQISPASGEEATTAQSKLHNRLVHDRAA